MRPVGDKVVIVDRGHQGAADTGAHREAELFDQHLAINLAASPVANAGSFDPALPHNTGVVTRWDQSTFGCGTEPLS
ncbi:hypothetical protein OG866_00625 [Streptomyces sp. NBC_00663]|uniref:hypothetical protein n=1 Tax=Streptomyces sp. NBC_00663 TaxID=2975801 RepID=UPI002E31471D|nr:hypothetical protein [Streptomyces sp. NBC_00663]